MMKALNTLTKGSRGGIEMEWSVCESTLLCTSSVVVYRAACLSVTADSLLCRKHPFDHRGGSGHTS